MHLESSWWESHWNAKESGILNPWVTATGKKLEQMWNTWLPSLLYDPSVSWSCWMIPSTYRMVLPEHFFVLFRFNTHAKHLWRSLHRHTQNCALSVFCTSISYYSQVTTKFGLYVQLKHFFPTEKLVKQCYKRQTISSFGFCNFLLRVEYILTSKVSTVKLEFTIFTLLWSLTNYVCVCVFTILLYLFTCVWGHACCSTHSVS